MLQLINIYVMLLFISKYKLMYIDLYKLKKEKSV
jgi:hypothetical protein